ncbi:MAG: glycosyltransferase [Phycisphaerales bacterium]|nr:glycosyltransferase [Phycisphaerales bacterium]
MYLNEHAKPARDARPQSGSRANGATPPRGPRIALYSHDTQGLGHIRRNLLISHALCGDGASPIILLLSGLREASAFAMPAGVDCLTLPSLGKDADGVYYPRSLGVPMDDLMTMRSRSISAALQSFVPDVLIVDKVPRGVYDELVPSLAWLHGNGRTRIILGLREILDAPSVVAEEWRRGDYAAAIRQYYDRIWVYGDRAVFDPVHEYAFDPDLASLVRYSGYLNPRDAGDESTPEVTGTDGTLCLVGGGRDGLPLAEAFLRGRWSGRGVLVTGPLMADDDRAALHTLATQRPGVEVREFVTDPRPLIAGASKVIAMGGYNTMCEVLAYRKPALIVPRIEPRTEQLIRATRFAQRGLVDMLHPDDLTAPALTAWIDAELRPMPAARDAIDFAGVERLPELLREAIGAPGRVVTMAPMGPEPKEPTHVAG